MSLNLNDKEILLFYKPGRKKDKNTLNLAKQVTAHINDRDVTVDPPTETQIKEIIQLLDRPIRDLIDKESEPFKRQYEDTDLTDDQWLKAITNEPDLLKTPIAFKGKRGIIVDTPSDVLELDPKKGYNSFNE